MRIKKYISKRGFTVVEVLVALAVMGLLLTGLAIAIKASFMNYNQNHDIFNAVNVFPQRTSIEKYTTIFSLKIRTPFSEQSIW